MHWARRYFFRTLHPVSPDPFLPLRLEGLWRERRGSFDSYRSSRISASFHRVDDEKEVLDCRGCGQEQFTGHLREAYGRLEEEAENFSLLFPELFNPGYKAKPILTLREPIGSGAVAGSLAIHLGEKVYEVLFSLDEVLSSQPYSALIFSQWLHTGQVVSAKHVSSLQKGKLRNAAGRDFMVLLERNISHFSPVRLSVIEKDAPSKVIFSSESSWDFAFQRK